MKLYVVLDAPTTPFLNGADDYVNIVAEAARARFKQQTPDASLDVSIEDSFAVLENTLPAPAAEDATGQFVEVTWTDLTDAEVIGYIVRIYDDQGDLHAWAFEEVGTEISTIDVTSAGTYTASVAPVLAAAESAATEVVVA